jgi:hypothetical protein
MQKANRYLQEIFIPTFWQKNLTVFAKNLKPEFVPVPKHWSCVAYFAGRQLAISEVIEPTKSSLFDLEIQNKIDAIKLAEKIGNVSEAARTSGCSRETIYRNKKILQEKGPLALKRTFRKDIIHKNRAAKNIEDTVISFSLKNPHLGQAQVSAHIKANYAIELSPSGVRSIWLRENMNTMALRINKTKPSQISC